MEQIDTAQPRMKRDAEAMLFACGPLANDVERRRLFGENVSLVPAKMLHWARFRGSDGQEFARQTKGASVEGYVIPVSAAQIGVADKSVAGANLQRAVTMVEVDGEKTWAFVYTRRGDGERID
ncbi:MAG TPA: hypothetical protein VGN14_07005 [Candidatus Elarobacter sp.]